MGKKAKKDYSEYSIEKLFNKLNKQYQRLLEETPQLKIASTPVLSSIPNLGTHANTTHHAVKNGQTKPSEQTSIAIFCNWVTQLNTLLSPIKTQHSILKKIKKITAALHQKTQIYQQATTHKKPAGGTPTCLVIKSTPAPRQKTKTLVKSKKRPEERKYDTQSICTRLTRRADELRSELNSCCFPWSRNTKQKKIAALDTLKETLRNEERTCKTAQQVSNVIKASKHDNPALTSGFFSRRTDQLLSDIMVELTAPAA